MVQPPVDAFLARIARLHQVRQRIRFKRGIFVNHDHPAGCYAETFAERFRGVKGHPYEQGFDLRLVPEKLTEPLTWRSPKLVFVNSMSDLFQDGVPDEYIEAVCRGA